MDDDGQLLVVRLVGDGGDALAIDDGNEEVAMMTSGGNGNGDGREIEREKKGRKGRQERGDGREIERERGAGSGGGPRGVG
uniref:Uncharacterized protein n=1 Tax=Oryza sativa subsp. japonica TaxID=39947 RepID=Q652Y0_ORYSJ|nr:hypothetical protein [Oryza sativa Japonica Group]BAD46137.1 hypothetical protein [Oryza sativa Japonica Group]